MSSGEQLKAWCERNKVVAFEGVFCANTLPVPFQPDNMCFIFNHSPCDSPSGGSHWLACRVQHDRAYWFDSFGLPPHAVVENDLMGSRKDPDPRFGAWLKAMGVIHIDYNERDIQSIASDVCGHYACYFAKHGLPGKNRKAWRFLSSNVRENDSEIRELVRL